MGYEINVALNGIHFFATHERSLDSEEKLKRVLIIFKEKFPEAEGYNITVTYWKKIGEFITIDSILNE